MGVWALPKAIAIKSQDFKDRGHIYRRDNNGAIALGEADVFSTKARIEVEQAKTDSKYVNLRFSYTNRYMHRTSDGSWAMAAVSTKPQEDLSDPFCTLFEPIKVDGDIFYLIHAQSGGRLVIDSASFLFFVEFDLTSTTRGYLSAVDFDSLVRLPVRGNLAFIGDNGKYLNTTDLSNPNTLFWPIKINANTIALRAADGKFCQRRVTSNLANGSIGTEDTSLTKEAELQVEELVTKSLVNNVRYQSEYGRVFNEIPHTGWSSTVVNSQDVDVTFSLSFTYQDTKEYTFARSYTLETGVPTVFDAALPFVGPNGSIDEAAAKINAELQWNAVNSMTRTVTGKGSVTVPAKETHGSWLAISTFPRSPILTRQATIHEFPCYRL
ncbi:hypothetical protein SASPL_106971 [Salvia splendens]|uniref:Agglutinin domain-containing protein n=1 Tax=Salvia splendens TaxID=180675 RepID=A0A8X8YE34_SALSN|nr:hypothetical protein SASPL_106971 [Salvia splendens]